MKFETLLKGGLVFVLPVLYLVNRSDIYDTIFKKHDDEEVRRNAAKLRNTPRIERVGQLTEEERKVLRKSVDVTNEEFKEKLLFSDETIDEKKHKVADDEGNKLRVKLK